MTGFFPLVFLLATTTKTIYLIRHAESEENVRMDRLYNVGRSLKRRRPPSPRDVYSGSKLLAMNSIGRADSSLSENGRAQVRKTVNYRSIVHVYGQLTHSDRPHSIKTQKVEEMYSKLKKANFTQSLDLIAHSPLVRAKDTCYGVLDLSCACPMVELDCLREVTPRETLRRGRQPVKSRIDALQSWLETQRFSSTIALVGHSEYFRVMLGLPKRFNNCDVWKLSYQEGGQWTDLQLEHTLNAEA